MVHFKLARAYICRVSNRLIVDERYWEWEDDDEVDEKDRRAC